VRLVPMPLLTRDDVSGQSELFSSSAPDGKLRKVSASPYLSLSRALLPSPLSSLRQRPTPRGEVLAIAAQARRERGGVLPKLCHACVLPMFDGCSRFREHVSENALAEGEGLAAAAYIEP
jgi:hypothetical protein